MAISEYFHLISSKLQLPNMQRLWMMIVETKCPSGLLLLVFFSPINVSIWSLIILAQHCLWCFIGGGDLYVQHQENETKKSNA